MAIIKGEHIVRELIIGDGANIIRGAYSKDEAKAKAYKEGVKLLERLREEQGGFELKADNADRPQYIHQIEIRWTEADTELQAKRVGNILSKFDTMIFTKEKILADEWLLSSEIYEEVNDASEQSKNQGKQ